MTAHEQYDAGNLAEAVTAALDEVKRDPTNGGKRTFLCELLCLTGDLERADRQLDTLVQQDPQAMPGVSVFRQLIRAEQARQQFFTEGRLPDFLSQEVTPDLRCHLEAAVLIREGKAAEAAELLDRVEAERPAVRGACNDRPFEGLRDLDDLMSSFFEVLTSTGKYFWIPIERVASVEFHAFTRPRDLIWRQANMVVRDGPDGEVYLPAVYAGSAAEPDPIRLGRATEWRGETGTPIRGLGQKVYLVGSDDLPILELKNLVIES